MPEGRTLHSVLPPTEGGSNQFMLRAKLSQLLAACAVKVAQDKTPERVKAQLKVRKEALAQEVNGYRTALSNFISPN
jgi:hypothetical protein